jgi:hypothetical protein
LNYFNYFTEIEDAFVRRRGKHLMLSPMDWALIESWKEMNVPLHVALRGIEKAFDSWESKPRKRSVKSLLYCQEEVEAQYAEWLEARLGSEATSDVQTKQIETAPFSRADLLQHLKLARTNLSETLAVRRRTQNDELAESLDRAVALIQALEDELAASSVADAQKLELSLTGLERLLSDAIFSVVPEDRLEQIKSEVKEQLKPYQSHMEKKVYQQTFDNLLLKRLRETFAVPRLSLFYL